MNRQLTISDVVTLAGVNVLVQATFRPNGQLADADLVIGLSPFDDETFAQIERDAARLLKNIRSGKSLHEARAAALACGHGLAAELAAQFERMQRECGSAVRLAYEVIGQKQPQALEMAHG